MFPARFNLVRLDKPLKLNVYNIKYLKGYSSNIALIHKVWDLTRDRFLKKEWSELKLYSLAWLTLQKHWILHLQPITYQTFQRLVNTRVIQSPPPTLYYAVLN